MEFRNIIVFVGKERKESKEGGNFELMFIFLFRGMGFRGEGVELEGIIS